MNHFMTDELSLLLRIKEGDHASFRTIYDTHVVNLYRFLRQFSRNDHEAEEWVQRTFIKAYERIDSFDGHSRFSTCLFAIGLNEMRSDRRRAAILPLEPVDEDFAAVQNPAEDQFEWDDLMQGWLSELDEAKRAVFLLAEVEGYSHAEIAGMLKIKESTSRTILTRTKRWLRNQWCRNERRTGS